MKKDKYQQLLQYLKNLRSCAVAFSGGVDSAFLLAAAKEALGDNVLAITVKTNYIPDWEIAEARMIAKELKVEHKILELPFPEEIHQNPPNRCYLCKQKLFTEMTRVSKNTGFKHVVDGSNADDKGEFRPGMRALQELHVISPLKENGINKENIREQARKMGLPVYDKPAHACLLTRIPYNTEIKQEELDKVDQAELYLMKHGYRVMRVRAHGDLARIELGEEAFKNILNKKQMHKVAKSIKKMGFRYVTLDMFGYRSGSMDG